MPKNVKGGLFPQRLQWVRGPITAVMAYPGAGAADVHDASMGPRSDNRGYGELLPGLPHWRPASMGPRSDNRGYEGVFGGLLHTIKASMGPRSDNRGYGDSRCTSCARRVRLQ